MRHRWDISHLGMRHRWDIGGTLGDRFTRVFDGGMQSPASFRQVDTARTGFAAQNFDANQARRRQRSVPAGDGAAINAIFFG
ncbi:hypothetical protein CCAX7_59590 [Capsulimonas corticalis]|uniref:Uncharacterized protein n=1 Tax=Capsulimonas corticalis TaxID=2219043 RepID=A0A402CZM7_9BACT|nr:hypothetical protein CCAX7_59590 [Capsulimonas corticalis]